MDADRRSTLEIAVEFLTAARELTGMARKLDSRKAKQLRIMADRFTDRGLALMVRDLQASKTSPTQQRDYA
jgi:hypothetical protein